MTATKFKNAVDHFGNTLNFFVNDGKFSKQFQGHVTQEVDLSNKLVIPGLINSHTHAAMTLFKGFADDLTFKEGWEGKVWPAEKKMNPQDCQVGMRFAVHELQSSGTTWINDMYFFMEHLSTVCIEENMPANLSLGPIIPKIFPGEYREKILGRVKELQKLEAHRISGVLTPHAPYSLSREDLQWVAET